MFGSEIGYLFMLSETSLHRRKFEYGKPVQIGGPACAFVLSPLVSREQVASHSRSI